MKITQPTPQYCTECEAPQAMRVTFESEQVVQNGGFALCTAHALELAERLLSAVRARLR